VTRPVERVEELKYAGTYTFFVWEKLRGAM